MRTGGIFLTTVAGLLGIVLLPSSSQSVGADAPAPEEWVSLFDGKTLTGWEGDKSLWKVEQGLLVGDSPGIPRNQFLATTKRYADFEMQLEFRLVGGSGNSGIQFRSERVPRSTEVSGYQADIGQQYWGCLYDESRRNKVLVQATPQAQAAFKKNDWNTYSIRAAGDHIVLQANGTTTVDYRERGEKIASSGILALQVHSGPPTRVEFRKIRIRELKPAR